MESVVSERELTRLAAGRIHFGTICEHRVCCNLTRNDRTIVDRVTKQGCGLIFIPQCFTIFVRSFSRLVFFTLFYTLKFTVLLLEGTFT